MEWINIKNKMPRNNRYVLTYTPDMAVPFIVQEYQGYYGEDDNEWYEG